MMLSRRRFGLVAGASLASWALADACAGSDVPQAAPGRVAIRLPDVPAKTTARGTARLGLGDGRDAILKMPDPVPTTPLALAVTLHGATGSADAFLRRLSAATMPPNLALLAIDSRGTTWDAIRGRFDADVAFIGHALERVVQTVAVDPARLSLLGFSDGATYAVSLGLINGDLFPRIVAFSVGYVIDGAPHGHPSFFLSHGTSDPILPIDQCGRRIAYDLKAAHYDVTYREFDGGHEVPPAIATEAFAWLAK